MYERLFELYMLYKALWMLKKESIYHECEQVYGKVIETLKNSDFVANFL